MARYTSIPILKTVTGEQYYKGVIYPEIPRTDNDLYVITAYEDRFDLLANQFYQSPSLWWVIAAANPEYYNSMYAPIGFQIRIPANVAGVINNFNIVNQ
jgi:hypothetical protein